MTAAHKSRKRRVARWRGQTAEEARQCTETFLSGHLHAVTVEQVIRQLHK